MNTFELNILTDLKTVFSGQAGYCGIISVSGSMGFEAFHEPFLGILRDNSDVTYTDSYGKTGSVTLGSGIIKFNNNKCTITCTLADKGK